MDNVSSRILCGQNCIENAIFRITLAQDEHPTNINNLLMSTSLIVATYRVQFAKGDVTKWEDLLSAFKQALSFSPSNTIDIVVPNAGVASKPLIPWLNETPEDSETGDPLQPSQAVLDVNFTAVYNTALLALYWFKKFPGSDLSYSKNIVFVGSMASYGSMVGVPNYGGSKYGVRGIFKALRELPKGFLGEGKPNVRFNMIAPSWIVSGMTSNLVPHLEKSSVVIGVPHDCAYVVLRMCVDENVKGRLIDVP
jgi:5'-hydroxyaverantin dehydrogenase